MHSERVSVWNSMDVVLLDENFQSGLLEIFSNK